MRAYLLALVLVLAGLTHAGAQQSSVDKAQCYTAWDDRFFYLSVKVDCADVVASHKVPNAPVTGDDCVMVYFQSDNARVDSPTGSTFCMAVSAAGGAQFSAGSADGKLEPVTVHTFKYGASVQGTINNSDDIDTSYMVEIALPWALLGAEPPKFGDMMGFNILIRRNGWKPDFVSLSSRVKAEPDVLKPSSWASIVFTTFAFGARPEPDKILSIRNIVRPPTVNGRIEEKEWPRNSAFSVEIPLPPGFVYEAKFPTQKMVIAPYFYHWRQQRAGQSFKPGLNAVNGGVALTDFPESGIGPWFSGDRIGWHKNQVRDALEAGVDVILPAYYRDSNGGFAEAGFGLDCLIGDLQELRSEGKSFPTVGMWLDLASVFGFSQPSSSDEERSSAYAAVKDFFGRVPPDFRAFAQTGKPDPGRMGALLFVTAGLEGLALSSDAAAYISERFASDFGGTLVWAASEGALEQSADVDALFALSGQQSSARHSRITLAVVTPGRDDSAV